MEPGVPVVRPLNVRVDSNHDLETSQATFEVFYRRSWTTIYRPLAATLGDPDLAAEAVDEAMVRAFTKWATVSAMENAEGWVYRVAYRWSVDRLRRRRTEGRLAPKTLDRPVPDGVDIEPHLDRALANLPIGQRAVVILACALDWSEREIAAALGIRQGTVKSRLSRGLARLREELGT